MILILAQPGTEKEASAVKAAFEQEFSLLCPPEVLPAGAIFARSCEWDDLILVIFNSNTLDTASVKYLQDFRTAHKTGGSVIPIGVNPNFRTPPDPISGIKAVQYNGTPEILAKIVQSAGVFLGLSLRPGSQKIFVSYRANDGKSLANSMYGSLQAAGFDAWLDEAGENLNPGDDVQEVIRKNLESAALVLLVDTPNAPDSPWIKIEVDLANSQLIPVLPAVAGGEQATRFIQLAGLRRWALVKQNGIDDGPLSEVEWESVRAEIDQLLLSCFRRRLRILSRARRVFEGQGYDWHPIDERLRMYLSRKKITALQSVVAFCHCLIQDITFVPALKAWWDYVTKYQGSVNQRLCIYDREKLLSQPEIETLADNLPGMNAILAHYSELETLVAQFR